MSENKREMVKITIELPDGNIQVLECHGLAMTTLTDKGDKYDCGVALMGNVSIPDLIALRENAETNLVEAIDQSIKSHSSNSKNPLAGLLAILGGR